MSDRIRVGILGMQARPAVYHVAKKMMELGAAPSVIFMDPHISSPKDMAIWHQRTAGRIPDQNLDDLGIPIVSGCNHRSEDFPALVAKHQINLLVSAATPGILKAKVLNSCRLGILNVHPGHLPDYRGCTCVEWAIYNDDPVGNTVHFMSEGIDEGPIVAVEDYAFTKKDRYVDIRVKTLTQGFALVAKAACDAVKDNGIRSTPQGAGTYYKPIPEDKMAAVLKKLEDQSYRYQL